MSEAQLWIAFFLWAVMFFGFAYLVAYNISLIRRNRK